MADAADFRRAGSDQGAHLTVVFRQLEVFELHAFLEDSFEALFKKGPNCLLPAAELVIHIVESGLLMLVLIRA